MSNGSQYQIIAINQSANSGDFCVFQQDASFNPPGALLPLAWFVKYVNPSTTAYFRWTLTYSFVWAETGQLEPGVVFSTAQNVPANLTTENQITFTFDGSGFDFENQTQGPVGGSLGILETSSVPANKASVGIGMAGNATFAVQAQPNINILLTPSPTYWIAFGTFTLGEALNPDAISNPVEIVFPQGVTSMTAILLPDNSWQIEPTADVNAKLIEARKTNPKARWGVAA